MIGLYFKECKCQKTAKKQLILISVSYDWKEVFLLFSILIFDKTLRPIHKMCFLDPSRCVSRWLCSNSSGSLSLWSDVVRRNQHWCDPLLQISSHLPWRMAGASGACWYNNEGKYDLEKFLKTFFFSWSNFSLDQNILYE